ncbi:hypothetical protein VNI00_000266 [Paramarasmius palmivorus]|uniref:THIF-type NAD/FAD binding fold domain-containing protein n=1 Tax=Paramarasmius palmivorus TaxID=297713 RepID=A0AAW0EGL3_9AGAR
MFIGRVHHLRQPDGACIIGLKVFSSIFLLSYDFAAGVALTTSTVNVAVLTHLHGEELGWLCLGSCAVDVIVNAVAIFWVTRGAGDSELNTSAEAESHHGPAVVVQGISASKGVRGLFQDHTRSHVEEFPLQVSVTTERHTKISGVVDKIKDIESSSSDSFFTTTTMKSDSQDIEAATTAVKSLEGQPDNKTRRYDRQLRLWASSGQTALENARILVISASATSTSILKNLVLPGIGHFTILDHTVASGSDAGNNFFLDGPASIGKPRAEEAVRLLLELNEGVDGKADLRDVNEILESEEGRQWVKGFTLVIAVNVDPVLVDKLGALLWGDEEGKDIPLMVVNSAGFLAEFYIQYREHPIIESHTETAPSLRLDKPFPALFSYATSLDFDSMDPTDHGHVPYVYILVHLMDKWKKEHDGSPPKTYEEKKQFKSSILAMKKKIDEENFDEAEAQAYRSWTDSNVPSEVAALLKDPRLDALTPDSPTFFHLLYALKKFVEEQGVFPLTSTLPDMKANTSSYIELQKLYKARAEEEKAQFKKYLQVSVADDVVDLFVKNVHGIKLLKGRKWADFLGAGAELAEKLTTNPKETSTHLALTASRKYQGLLPTGTELPEEFGNAVGELARAPNADLPNTAAFLGGLVAQEAIKMITKQYVPINGCCVVDLIESWTGVM